MTNKLEDFYCDEVLSGNTPVKTVLETENVLSFYHTRPFYDEHIVVIPKKHILSLITVQPDEMKIMEEDLWCYKGSCKDNEYQIRCMYCFY